MGMFGVLAGFGLYPNLGRGGHQPPCFCPERRMEATLRTEQGEELRLRWGGKGVGAQVLVWRLVPEGPDLSGSQGPAGLWPCPEQSFPGRQATWGGRLGSEPGLFQGRPGNPWWAQSGGGFRGWGVARPSLESPALREPGFPLQTCCEGLRPPSCSCPGAAILASAHRGEGGRAGRDQEQILLPARAFLPRQSSGRVFLKR